MDTYRWQHNNAVVTRLYYSERMVEVLFGMAATATAIDGFFISRNYFASAARARIIQYWGYAALLSGISLYVLLKPLTSHEISLNWKKRRTMGKWLWSVYHLDEEEWEV
ncbi:unnamed protein product [Moneuplotes crassus]|uniref:Uncharacterized protein n=1 Tax=Euplotes crassus TaxID=5936 RepID=A0AAD1Y511_EUPCR|nr:unnamed protein product [Moneuplotes crassus]